MTTWSKATAARIAPGMISRPTCTLICWPSGVPMMAAPLPAVVSVAKEINDPRYPSFMGIRKAGRAKIPTLTVDDLGLSDLSNATTWTNIRKPEERSVEITMIDGGSPAEKAEKLADALMSEKVI